MWFACGIVLSFAYSALACSHGWAQNEGSCYHLSRDQATWVEASRMCEIHGGKLAHVETPEEQLFLNGLVANYRDAHTFWLGASDWSTEGEWVWEPEGLKVNYTNWMRNRPDNYGRREHCLIMERHDSDQWDDRDCHNVYHYICEMMVASSGNME